jgi:hypothetical protein
MMHGLFGGGCGGGGGARKKVCDTLKNKLDRKAGK